MNNQKLEALRPTDAIDFLMHEFGPIDANLHELRDLLINAFNRIDALETEVAELRGIAFNNLRKSP